MHSCETLPPPPPTTGPNLLLELGALIIRSRGQQDRLLRAKMGNARASTSGQVLTQPKAESEETKPGVEAQLGNHVQALLSDQIPICIEVLLAPDCEECRSRITLDAEATYDKRHTHRCGLLLERWTMQALPHKPHDGSSFITSQWLLNAVRSQLHFSQLSAWLATLKRRKDDPPERRRKLSRESCNYKKMPASPSPPPPEARSLNIVYSVKIPGETYQQGEFGRPPAPHCFPAARLTDNLYLKVVLESLPRIDDIPTVKCTCRADPAESEDLTGKLSDLTLGPRCAKYPADSINSNIGPSTRRLSIVSNPSSTEYLFTSTEKTVKTEPATLLDDRMHTPCSENGKHKCSCDEESDTNHRSSNSFNETKKLDERRLKEIAKYKRRLRKESKLKLCDSTSSEGDGQQKATTHTSIPILQAARFDRLRAIGCYRNQTYLTLPASRCEGRSPFLDSAFAPPAERRATRSVCTQTEAPLCSCNGLNGDLNRLVRNQTYLTLPASRCEGRSPFLDSAFAPPAERRATRSVCTQTEAPLCSCNGQNGDLNRLVRNQTYLTLPASRCEGRSPFLDSAFAPPAERRATRSVCTQTEAPLCSCAVQNGDMNRLVRSDATYDLASLDGEKEQNGGRRKREDEGNALKKHKCDNLSSNLTCDNIVDNSSNNDEVVKRPKLRRYFPIVDRLEKIVSDRFCQNAEKDMEELHLKTDDTVFEQPKVFLQKTDSKRQKTYSISEDDYVMFEKCDYGTIDRCDVESPNGNEDGFKFPDAKKTGQEALVPSPTEMDRFRWRFDSAASMVFHTKTGLPLTSSPAPLRRGNNCFDFDDSINGISGIKSALFHPISPPSPAPPASPASPASPSPSSPAPEPEPRRERRAEHKREHLAKKEETPKLRIGPSAGLLGSFEESALKGRLEPVATVHGFAAELGASGAFCPPHRRLPVTVFFYAPGGTNAPYMGHINLGSSGYRVARSGTIQVSLFNPHGTLVKMFVVLYDLTCMPPMARTFLRQRTLYMPAGAEPPRGRLHKWLRYLIHLRFMTSKSGKLYLHTDIRIIVSRKADLDTATAHSLFRPIAKSEDSEKSEPSENSENRENRENSELTEKRENRTPNRVFGGSSEFDSEMKGMREIGYENQNGVSYELRSFTYAPENPKYSPR